MHPSLSFAPAPRQVPWSLAVLSVCGGAAQVGWVVFGFGMLFFWIFAGQADLSFITFRGPVARTVGRVTTTETTGASENRQSVVANHYEYSVAGRRLSGVSYTTGSSAAAGQEVTVEYKPDHPDRSRIEGMRRAMFGPGAFVATIFPLIGLLIIVATTAGGLRRASLLRRGVLTTGKLVAKERTNMTVNRHPVYELTFEFISRDGRRCEARTRTHDSTRLEDEHAEPLLYDPEDPSRVYLLDEVPGRPQLDGTGNLVARTSGGFFAAIIPTIVIALHVWYLAR